jgi:hypothetical protein
VFFDEFLPHMRLPKRGFDLQPVFINITSDIISDAGSLGVHNRGEKTAFQFHRLSNAHTPSSGICLTKVTKHNFFVLNITEKLH